MCQFTIVSKKWATEVQNSDYTNKWQISEVERIMIRVMGETNDPENSILEDFKVKRYKKMGRKLD